LWGITCFHVLGAPDSKWIKVTARNLFHPTASAPVQEVGFLTL
jgi:hypothetical protein